jgi:hypothetical protein
MDGQLSGPGTGTKVNDPFDMSRILPITGTFILGLGTSMAFVFPMAIRLTFSAQFKTIL